MSNIAEVDVTYIELLQLNEIEDTDEWFEQKTFKLKNQFSWDPDELG